MARLARVVVPDLPHHVSQRGNRREPLFFEADDYRLYRRLVAAAARRAGTAVWAYCLMPNPPHASAAAVKRRVNWTQGSAEPPASSSSRTMRRPGSSMKG